MARAKVFIDGREGTTGLEIENRLRDRTDIQLLEIAHAERKDLLARREIINTADVVVTCLPDAAAREAIGLVKNENTRVIDPSTAHRTALGWVYGFPELLPEQRERVQNAKRVSVPGCHATGFLSIVVPLVARGLLPRDYPIVAHSVTGYSGGGRKMIEDYERAGADRKAELSAPRAYALGLAHKHVPEMHAISGLASAPVFEPVVSNFYRGMLVSVPLLPRLLPRAVTPSDVHSVLSEYYAGERFVRVVPLGTGDDNGALGPLGCNGTNRLDLFVFGHAEQIMLLARLDNLGKGASGAAVQCLNLMLGAGEATGLSA